MCTYTQTMSEDKEEEGIEVDIDDNNDDFGIIEPITSSEEVKESSTEPVEIFKEEIVTVVENPDAEENEEEEENQQEAYRIGNSISEDEGVYEQVKAQSVQLRKLTDVIESLQSQIKQLQETIRLSSHKTTPARRRTRSNTKTKKKTITGKRNRKTRGSKKK
jgi:hypothetical protein